LTRKILGHGLGLGAALTAASEVTIGIENVERRTFYNAWWMNQNAHVQAWHKELERRAKQARIQPHLDKAQAKRLRKQAKRLSK